MKKMPVNAKCIGQRVRYMDVDTVAFHEGNVQAGGLIALVVAFLLVGLSFIDFSVDVSFEEEAFRRTRHLIHGICLGIVALGILVRSRIAGVVCLIWIAVVAVDVTPFLISA